MSEKITNPLKSQGYNKKEKSLVYGSLAVGALAPIIGARYAIFSGLEGNPGAEALAWGGSLLLNLSPMISKQHMPIPAYTGLISSTIAFSIVQKSKNKREKKEKINHSLKNIENIIKGNSPEGILEDEIANYRIERDFAKSGLHPINIKKYNKKLSKITKNLNSVPHGIDIDYNLDN